MRIIIAIIIQIGPSQAELIASNTTDEVMVVSSDIVVELLSTSSSILSPAKMTIHATDGICAAATANKNTNAKFCKQTHMFSLQSSHLHLQLS